MKNITLALNEEVLAKVRRIAAENGTTVNGMVREHLTRLADQNDRAKQARMKLVELAEASTWDPGPDWQWNRDDAYDRAVLHRYERADLRGLAEEQRTFEEDEGTKDTGK